MAGIQAGPKYARPCVDTMRHMNLPIVIASGVVIALGSFFAWRRFESLRDKSSEELRAILRSSEWLAAQMFKLLLYEQKDANRH